MVKFVAYFLVVISLLTSPVFAGLSDLKSPDDSSSVAAKVDKSKATKDGESKPASDHQCCTSHAHYGASSPTYSHAPTLTPSSQRLPMVADEFLSGFGPDPLLEPPSRA